MKKIIILVVVLAVIVFFGRQYFAKDVEVVVEKETIVGCYAMRTDKDVYTMNISSQVDKDVTGTLEFKNFEKDSSSGTFVGTYENDVLIGDYSFRSEGLDSVMQVAFKKFGDDFVRGYGDLNETGDRFADINTIEFEITSPLAVFSSEDCVLGE